jgi:glycosyltransferase involved in cell wall biosynthesis
LGRISPEKRPDRALRIARAAGIPLKIAAKVDKADEDYFRNDIRPLFDGPGVEFVGEINDPEKAKFLGEAAALLFPVDWPEPFGLVMIEAMACGTPVLAFHRGSIPEVIDDGVTGKIVDNEDEAISVLPQILAYDRSAVRQRFDEIYRQKNGQRLCQRLSPVGDDMHVWRQGAPPGAQWRQRLNPLSIEKPPSQADADSEIPVTANRSHTNLMTT